MRSQDLTRMLHIGDDIACCQDDCKIAICVPPWVSICSACKNKMHESVSIKESAGQTVVAKPDPDEKKDCCDNKCKHLDRCVTP
jgi:hypothetical protein